MSLALPTVGRGGGIFNFQFSISLMVRSAHSGESMNRLLATRFGSKAMDLVHEGDFGKMVALRGDSIVSVPLNDAVASPKLVDPDSEIVRTARSLGTSFGDE